MTADLETAPSKAEAELEAKASKKTETAAKKAKPKATKKAVTKKAKPATKKAAKPAEKLERGAYAAKLKKALARREEPTDREKRLLAAFGGVGKPKTLQELGDSAFKRERPAAKRQSWARNNLRWFVAQRVVKKVGRGTYQRVA